MILALCTQSLCGKVQKPLVARRRVNANNFASSPTAPQLPSKQVPRLKCLGPQT